MKGHVARGDAADVDAAVLAAATAAHAWRHRRPMERGRILTEMARQIRVHKDSLAAVESLETGKPMWQALAEIEYSAQYYEYYAGLVNLPAGETIDLGGGYHSYTRREPFGVVGIIVYMVGYPLLVGLLLWRIQKKKLRTDTGSIASFGWVCSAIRLYAERMDCPVRSHLCCWSVRSTVLSRQSRTTTAYSPSCGEALVSRMRA